MGCDQREAPSLVLPPRKHLTPLAPPPPGPTSRPPPLHAHTNTRTRRRYARISGNMARPSAVAAAAMGAVAGFMLAYQNSSGRLMGFKVRG